MSSIVPSLPVNRLTQSDFGRADVGDVAGKSAVAASAATGTPFWSAGRLPGSSGGLDLLGLRSPRASGDIAAMLAEVSLNLEITADDVRSNSAVARLSSLASALHPFDLATLEQDLNKKSALTAATQTTRDNLESKAGSLLAQRSATTSGTDARDTADLSILKLRSESLGNEIADLKTERAGVVSGTPEAAALDAAIAAKQTSQNGIDSSATSFGQQLSTNKGQVTAAEQALIAERAKEKPDKGQIAKLQTALDTAKATLSATRTNLDASATTGLATDRAALTAKLDDRRAIEAAALAVVTGASLASIAIAEFAKASYTQDATGKAGDIAGHDAGIEDQFDEIADEMKAVAHRASTEAEGATARLEADDASRLKRATALSNGMLAAIAGVVSSAAEIEPVAAPGLDREVGSGRVRIAR